MSPFAISFRERSMDEHLKQDKLSSPASRAGVANHDVQEVAGETAASRPGIRFYLAWVVAILVVLGALGAFMVARSRKLNQQAQARAQEQQRGLRVLVQPVYRPPAIRTLELPATLRGYTETPIYAKVSGYLRSIKVDKGVRVKKGQLLAVLEAPELDQQVANARATYNLNAITDQRNQSLLRENIVPRQTADESHNTMLAAKANVEQFQALEGYKLITAPFTGVVTARYVDPGALIPQTTTSTTNTPILSIATLSPLRVYSEVPQALAPFIRDGDPATVTVSEYAGRKFEGKITRHPEALTTATRTMLVEVDLPNRDQMLFPGMYARMALQVTAPVAVRMVSDDALVFRDGKPFVPVVRENRLKLVPVTLGFDDGVNVEVTGDLSDQDLVAVNVGQAAHDGEQVQPIRATQPH